MKNAVDYWYQKYLKEKLTWEDVRDIVVIADSMLTRTAWDDVEWPDEKVYYEEVLRKFNEQRNEIRRI